MLSSRSVSPVSCQPIRVESLNGGLVYTGLIDARPNDKVGFSFNENANPESYREAQIAAGTRVYQYETSFEVTYRAKIFSWLTGTAGRPIHHSPEL